jgi:fatty acid desaturase
MAYLWEEPKAEQVLVLCKASQSATAGYLSTEENASLSRRDSLRGAKQVLSQFAGIAALGTLNLCLLPDAIADYSAAQPGYAFAAWCAAFCAQAFAMSTLYYGLHECVHRTVFDDSIPEYAWLNGLFANVYGFLTLHPPARFRCAHFNHHRFTGDPGRDPELQDTLEHMRATSVLRYAVVLTGVPHWVGAVGALVRHGILEIVLPAERLYLTKHTRQEVLREAWYFSAAYIVIISSAFAFRPAAGWWYDLVVFGWLAPLILGQPFRQFIAIAEHEGCRAGENMLSNSRTLSGTSPALCLLTWGAPFHSEHHAFPDVPFHARSTLHRVLRSRAGTESSSHAHGYRRFHAHLFASLATAAP